MSVTFNTVVREARANVTGFKIPAEVIAQLTSHKRFPVLVTVAGYTYPSTVAVYDNEFLLPLSMENREAAGVFAGQEVEVTLEVDNGPRTVEIPVDLRTALGDKVSTFESLAPSKRKEFVRQVNEAKAQETRDRRIAGIVAKL